MRRTLPEVTTERKLGCETALGFSYGPHGALRVRNFCRVRVKQKRGSAIYEVLDRFKLSRTFIIYISLYIYLSLYNISLYIISLSFRVPVYNLYLFPSARRALPPRLEETRGLSGH